MSNAVVRTRKKLGKKRVVFMLEKYVSRSLSLGLVVSEKACNSKLVLYRGVSIFFVFLYAHAYNKCAKIRQVY